MTIEAEAIKLGVEKTDYFISFSSIPVRNMIRLAIYQNILVFLLHIGLCIIK